MSTPTQEQIQKAVEVLRDLALLWIEESEGAYDTEHITGRAALALLDGIHLYGSRFKPGDEVIVLHGRTNQGLIVLGGPFMVTATSSDGLVSLEDDTSVDRQAEVNCFPTREAAEAVAKERNEAGR